MQSGTIRFTLSSFCLFSLSFALSSSLTRNRVDFVSKSAKADTVECKAIRLLCETVALCSIEPDVVVPYSNIL
jgi:hypothetical protein